MVSKLKYAERKGIEKGRVKGKAEGIEEGIEKGIEKGIERGRIEERKKLAKKLLNDGLEVILVSKYTNLSVEELKELIEKELGQK
jgi:predicted transposase/invertase (TIGR01784 family)